MVCTSVGFVLLVVFYYGFPETRKSFVGFWINRSTIVPQFGFRSVFSELTALQILYFGWAMIITSIALTSDLKINSLPESIPLNELVGTIIVTIIFEELIFRGIFLFIAHVAKQIFHLNLTYILGLVSSVVFGLMHLFNYGVVNLQTLTLITIQTLGGLIFWWVAKRYSFVTAVWAHLLCDALILIPATLATM
jgi:membrane protease YdiL (CAAX protease family)